MQNCDLLAAPLRAENLMKPQWRSIGSERVGNEL